VARPKSDSKDLFIAATSTLLRRKGYHGTSLKDIATEAGAPIGSLYFLFPAGKDQLVLAALHASGHGVEQVLDSVLAGEGTAEAVVRRYLSLIEAVLVGSGYIDGCPIATVALEVAPLHAELSAAIAAIFESWLAVLERHLRRVGLTKSKARNLATLSLTAVEGALVVTRAQQRPDTFAVVIKAMTEFARSLSE
jgi:TetR/AcrR family transcriptional regulator, lmrAB and yxaGH operons repressor